MMRLRLIKERAQKVGKAWKAEYLCTCGNTTYVRKGEVDIGRIRSCGCLQKEIASKLAKGRPSTRKKEGTDANVKLRRMLRNRIYNALKGLVKVGTTHELTGCSNEDLTKHFESLFTEGMTWDNYGKWHVDHIVPCASFDLSKEENQKKCFHYSNLQPLWAIDNLRKNNKILPRLGPC